MSKNLMYSNSEYTRSYSGLCGVELNASASITSPNRMAYCENMYKDYDADGADVIESIPGFRKIISIEENIHSLYYHKSSKGDDHIIVHSENKLRRFPITNIDGIITGNHPHIATLENTKSKGFFFGGYLYIMDGVRIVRVGEDGKCCEVCGDDNPAYIPTTYVSGVKYEERSLLTDKFKEDFLVADPSSYFCSTDGLKYKVIDPLQRYCAVCGVEDYVTGDIHIPSFVTLFDLEYKVTEISDFAFDGNTRITAVYISEGISRVGICAFYGCTALKTAVTPATLGELSNGIFTDCISLDTLYLGGGIKSFGLSSLNNCTALKSIHYALDTDSYAKISGTSEVSNREIIYESEYKAVTLAFPMHSDTLQVEWVKVNGNECAFDTVTKKGLITHVLLRFDTISDATGVEVKVQGVMTELRMSFDGRNDSEGDGIRGYDAVMGCRVAAVFDGRIFFSGNPDLPNTVIYTDTPALGKRDEFYVSRYSYFNDGVGGYKVRNMLAVRDMLAVFKEGDDGTGSIFYHKRESTSSNYVSTIYPVAYVHSGICALGDAISFLDDPVFLTTEGVSALNSENINYQRSVACRSHNVNFYLLKEDLRSAELCSWKGYLVVGTGSRIYLADSRATFSHSTKNREYEWFVLSGIGTHRDDNTLYVYADEPIDNSIVDVNKCGQPVEEDVVIYSIVASPGVTYYYIIRNGKKYRVWPTGEKYGGFFTPASCFMAYGEHLFFGNSAGDVCVFNNDKRGIAPDYLKNDPNFDAQEYAKEMGNKIHPYYYTFDSHKVRYVIKTALDDCGIPHLTKNTVKKSLVVKARAYYPDSITCEAVTDKGKSVYVGSLPYADTDFGNLDFDSSVFTAGRYTSTALPEKEKKWIEKQIILSADKFRSPISVYSITYRYTIRGKIKNNA